MTTYRPDCPVCQRALGAISQCRDEPTSHAKRTCPACRRRFLLIIHWFPDRKCEVAYTRIPGLDPRRHEDGETIRRNPPTRLTSGTTRAILATDAGSIPPVTPASAYGAVIRALRSQAWDHVSVLIEREDADAGRDRQ